MLASDKYSNHNSEETTDLWFRLGLTEWVAIDLETTGLDSKSDHIIELGAVKFVNGKVQERYSQLVKPPVDYLPEFITELTGITTDDVINAPVLSELAPGFKEFVGDLPLVGQNVGFDLGFLQAAPELADHFLPSMVIPRTHDTNLAGRFLVPCLDGFGLAHLCETFRVQHRPNHRAADDAEATGELFAGMLAMLTSVKQIQIADALHFVASTNSPLANTLRCVLNAIASGYITDQIPPDALMGPYKGRANVYSISGDPRPDSTVTHRQIVRLFHEKGRFNRILSNYEVRQEQVDLSTLVAGAIRDNLFQIVEAGTGVGKSMGYLIPSLLSNNKVIVSTHTKNLQDQLFYDEIPRLGELFKFGFKAALLKGRRNYLCRTRWKNLVLDPERISTPHMRESAALIVRWVDETLTGDTSEINAVRDGGAFFRLFTSEPGFCTGKSCGGKCPLSRIRREALKADIVIVNHSLALLDLLGESSLLGEEATRLIFDEAHHIEDVATDQLGTELTAPGLKSSLERISRLGRKKGELYIKLSARQDTERLAESLEKLSGRAGELDQSVDALISAAGALLRSKIPMNAQYSTSFRYWKDDNIHKELFRSGEALLAGLAALTSSLSRIRQKIEQNASDDFPPDILQELVAATDESTANITALKLSLMPENLNQVNWVEVPPELNKPVQLKTAPLEIADVLAEGLWNRLDSVILTSATLTTGTGPDGFSHLIKRLGLDRLAKNRLGTAAFGSPFDFENNCKVIYGGYLPSPAEDSAGHNQQVAEICSRIATAHKRGMLILFTSYSALRNVDNYLKERLRMSDVEVFSQRGTRGRDRLIRQFRNAKGGAILLGTDSLWEGIDIPGPALQIVVIPKLPFAVPGDPVVAARIDKLRADGKNPFYEYQLPSAVLRIRQGAGRLIRQSTDKGVIIVLDPRVITKAYGSNVRAILPGKSEVVKSADHLLSAVSEFFD